MPAKPRIFDCPSCGEPTPEDEFAEGYCVPCRDDRQHALDLHNAQFDQWQRLSDDERREAIRREIR